ncbi:MAG: glycosyltransferase family 4 protein [Vicinamibacterales bacterium]
MSLSRPKVLFVGAFPPPGRPVFGGMVSSCAALLDSSFAERCEVVTLDTTQISSPPPPFWYRLLLSIPRMGRFVWRLERQRPDVVLLFAAIGASLVEKGAMAWLARARGVPVLMFPRGGAIIEQAARSGLAARQIRLLFGGASMVLCQSARWHAFACDVLRLRPACAPVIPNWTALPALMAIGRTRVPRPADAAVRLLFLGWLDREKGVQELLDACLALAASRRFTLTIAGEGDWSETARRFVEQHDLSSVVTFVGWLRGSAVHRALEEADVLVLPSWAEGLPNAMVEAMAAGLAVVVSAVGSVPDVVIDGVTGILTTPRDVPGLTVALGRVIDDPALRVRLGQAACEAAGQTFAVEPAADRLCAAIHHALSPKGADSRG